MRRLFFSDKQFDRGNNINLIRFVAAAMVIYGHMSHFTGTAMPYVFGQGVSTIAVKVFFILSGYLICQSYLRDSCAFRYFTRRVFRIFPGLIFVSFMTAFIAGPILSELSFSEYYSSNGALVYFVSNSVMNPVYNLPGVFLDNYYPNAVNGSLWTLPIEFSMYILLPIIFLVFRMKSKLKPWVMLIAALVFSCASLFHISFNPHSIFVVWGTDIYGGLVLIPYFFFGAFAALVKLEHLCNIQVAALLATIGSIATAGEGALVSELVTLAILPYITLSLSFPKHAIFGRVFAVNDYSYGLYLWAFPIQQTIVMLLGPDSFSVFIYGTICLIPSFLAAMISWHLVEKPASSLGKKITRWSRQRSVSNGTSGNA